jgi:aerobic-type carbon monoxide dehydrogenase small subunit (CoxS/CutS family)
VTATRVLHLTVNGTRRSVAIEPHRPLLDVLREELDLTGTKECCAVGECGACTVLVDGRAVNSCLVLAVEVDGATVTTVEGLAPDPDRLSRLQDAFLERGAVQCGFCIPGMAMTVHDLLEGNHAPTELETRQALAGNLCRCTGYRGVLDAVREVVTGRATAAGAADEARIPHQAPPGAGGVQPPFPQQHDGGMA